MKKKKLNKRKKRRGIYILPNLFTTVSLFFGFFSIVSTLEKKYEIAAVAILISCIFDVLDGKIARLTHTTSQFGMEYDSLSDLVAFGVAPGILIFKWSLQSIGRLGWLACFVYIACGALRLARFNVHVRNGKELSYFRGLPIPAGASFIACIILFSKIIEYHWNPFLILVSVYIISFLMVSNITYLSLKGDELSQSRPFNVLVTTVLLLVLIAYKPKLIIPVLVLSYVLSGPVLIIYRAFVQRGKRVFSKQNLSLNIDENNGRQ